MTLYAQDLWEVNDRLSLSAGLRLDDYSQSIRNNRTGAVGEAADTPFDYRFAARYRLTDNLTAHASYGRSFVLNSGTGRDGAGFAPEKGQGSEIGLAGAWDGLDLAATVFDIEKSNILTTDPVDSNYLAPVGKLTTRGIELDGSLKIDDAWQVVANYSLDRRQGRRQPVRQRRRAERARTFRLAVRHRPFPHRPRHGLVGDGGRGLCRRPRRRP